MINVHKIVDQRNQERQELEAKFYSLGWFDELIGCEPSQPENDSDWHGYSLGCRKYWAQKLEVEIATKN
jgi:hypothetical protein